MRCHGKVHSQPFITQFLATPALIPSPLNPATPGLADLTNRELEVTKLAADGKPNEDIARDLHLIVLTVRTHIQRAMTKLGGPRPSTARCHRLQERPRRSRSSPLRRHDGMT
jgi:DNA-binding NarL/FixJ family response regulator